MATKEEWNQRYNVSEFVYGEQPNNFFRDKLQKIPLGDLLLPGEGEGRNAIWAAKQGWNVTAFDFSETALEKANKLFKKHKISQKVTFVQSDIVTFETNKQFDVIALIYLHLPSPIREKAFKNLLKFLKPNGILIFESYHPDQLGNFIGGPKNPDLFASMEELKDIFKTLTIQNLSREEIELNEGTLHQGRSIVIRLIGKKESNGKE